MNDDELEKVSELLRNSDVFQSEIDAASAAAGEQLEPVMDGDEENENGEGFEDYDEVDDLPVRV